MRSPLAVTEHADSAAHIHLRPFVSRRAEASPFEVKMGEEEPVRRTET